MRQNIKIRTSGLLVALATLLVVFWPSWSNAQSPEDLTSQIQSDGTLLYTDKPPGNNGTGSEFCFTYNLYAGEYPATSTLVYGGGLDCSWYSDPWSSIIDFWSTSYISQVSPDYGDGVYWFGVDQGSGSVIDYIYKFEIVGGVYYLNYNLITNGISYTNNLDNINTRFTNVGITDASGTTGLVNFNIQYFIDSLEIDSSVSSRNPTLINVEYAKRPSVNFSTVGYSILPLANGSSSLVQNIDFDNSGTYDILIKFSNSNVVFGGAAPFPQSYIYTNITLVGGNLSSVGPIEYYDGRKTTVLGGYVYKDCSLTQFDNCLSNAFIYLFYPDPQVLGSVLSINNELSQRFPFAYLYDFQSLMTSLFSGSSETMPVFTVAFAGSDITIFSEELLADVPFVPFIRLVIGWLLWFTFAYVMYRRTINIFNTNQTI